MKNLVLLLAVAGLGWSLVGCDENKTKTMSLDELRWDMAGDLNSTYETTDEANNRMAHTTIINGRKINSDLRRLFLLDRPSRDVSAPSIMEYD